MKCLEKIFISFFCAKSVFWSWKRKLKSLTLRRKNAGTIFTGGGGDDDDGGQDYASRSCVANTPRDNSAINKQTLIGGATKRDERARGMYTLIITMPRACREGWSFLSLSLFFKELPVIIKDGPWKRERKKKLLFFFLFFPRKPDLASFRVMIRVARNKKLADSWPTCEQGREKEEGIRSWLARNIDQAVDDSIAPAFKSSSGYWKLSRRAESTRMEVLFEDVGEGSARDRRRAFGFDPVSRGNKWIFRRIGEKLSSLTAMDSSSRLFSTKRNVYL